MEAGGDEDEAIAALLHDGPEDQGGEQTLAVIRDRFGDRVAAIVAACSDTFEDPKPEWRERKKQYVSAADKLHNARATLRDLRQLGPEVWQRFTASRQDTVANYRSLIGAYDEAVPDERRAQVVEELRRIVDEMDRT